METRILLNASTTVTVSGIFTAPPNSIATLILAHGAGAPMDHPHMGNLASSLAGEGIATLRFNFPYMEAGGTRTDSPATCVEVFRNTVAHAQTLSAQPLYIGGHSFGGRMGSHFLSENPDPSTIGAVYFSFPLHPTRKPSINRASHLGNIRKPQLFVSGTRDSLATPALLESVVNKLEGARIHWLETADHGFKILKKSRVQKADVYNEAARVVGQFIRESKEI